MSPRSDPYLYPGTTTLINKFGIRDQKKLDEVEANYTSLRLSDLSENPMTGNYDSDHLRSMHRYADSVNMPIDRQLFQRNSEYLRSALVAARAIFHDLGDLSQSQHLYRIVYHALS